jgi:hypothetical protein
VVAGGGRLWGSAGEAGESSWGDSGGFRNQALWVKEAFSEFVYSAVHISRSKSFLTNLGRNIIINIFTTESRAILPHYFQ